MSWVHKKEGKGFVNFIYCNINTRPCVKNVQAWGVFINKLFAGVE